MLKRAVNICGGFSFLAYVTAAVLSYFLAQHTPANANLVRRGRFFAPLFGDADSGLSRFADSFTGLLRFTLAYATPLLVAACSAVVILILLNSAKSMESGISRLVFRWSVAFALVTAFAYPVLVQDFWLSAVWGRMPWIGLNPYHATAPESLIDSFPIESVDPQMTYGPLWAVVSTVVMGFAGNHAVIAGILFKAVLAGAWILTLLLVRRLLVGKPEKEQALGLVLLGWLPLGVVQSAGEGHNDVFMMAGVVLWLYSLQQQWTLRARLFLAAATLAKFVAAPLFLLDLLYFWRIEKRSWRQYAKVMALTAVVSVLVFAIFYRSPHFFDQVRAMQHWRFFEPSTALGALTPLFGIPVWRLPALVRLCLLLMPVYYIVRFFRQPDLARFYSAGLALLSAILFTQVGHVWPWFVCWVLVFAALNPESGLSRWVTGVAIAAPFVMIRWIADPEAGDNAVFQWPVLCWYGFSLLWLALGVRLAPRLEPRVDPNQSASA